MRLRTNVFGLVLGAYLASLAHGQEVAPFPTAKIAVVNIGEVFTKWVKANDLKKRTEEMVAPYKKKAAELKQEVTDNQKLVSDANTDAETKQKLEKKITAGIRQLEDIQKDLKQKLGKAQEQQLVEMFKEIHAAVKQHADANAINLVFTYGDPPDMDPFDFNQITRKLSAMDGGALTPFYSNPTLNITQPVITILNDEFSKTKTSPGL